MHSRPRSHGAPSSFASLDSLPVYFRRAYKFYSGRDAARHLPLHALAHKYRNGIIVAWRAIDAGDVPMPSMRNYASAHWATSRHEPAFRASSIKPLRAAVGRAASLACYLRYLHSRLLFLLPHSVFQHWRRRLNRRVAAGDMKRTRTPMKTYYLSGRQTLHSGKYQ